MDNYYIQPFSKAAVSKLSLIFLPWCDMYEKGFIPIMDRNAFPCAFRDKSGCFDNQPIVVIVSVDVTGSVYTVQRVRKEDTHKRADNLLRVTFTLMIFFHFFFFFFFFFLFFFFFFSFFLFLSFFLSFVVLLLLLLFLYCCCCCCRSCFGVCFVPFCIVVFVCLFVFARH